MLGFLHTIPWWMTLMLLPFVIIMAIIAKVAQVVSVTAALLLALLLGLWWVGRRYRRKQPRR